MRKYKMIRKLGSGLISQNFELVDIKDNQPYVMKVFKDKYYVKQRDPYYRESKILKELQHKNFIQYHHNQEDYTFSDKKGWSMRANFIIHELATNGDLQSYVSQQAFTAPMVRYFGLQLIKAIQYMHS